MSLTITLGDLLQIAAVLIGTFAIYTRLIERLARIEVKVDHLWERQNFRDETKKGSDR